MPLQDPPLSLSLFFPIRNLRQPALNLELDVRYLSPPTSGCHFLAHLRWNPGLFAAGAPGRRPLALPSGTRRRVGAPRWPLGRHATRKPCMHAACLPAGRASRAAASSQDSGETICDSAWWTACDATEDRPLEDGGKFECLPQGHNSYGGGWRLGVHGRFNSD